MHIIISPQIKGIDMAYFTTDSETGEVGKKKGQKTLQTFISVNRAKKKSDKNI